jgi:hypothetical protein
MGMTVQTSLEAEFLHVIASGDFSLDAAKETFVKVMEAVAEHQVAKIFFDGRGIEGNPKFIERFYFGEFAASTVKDYWLGGLCPYPTFAFVLKEPVLDAGRFGETVAVNRGLHVKVFDNEKEAWVWLRTE